MSRGKLRPDRRHVIHSLGSGKTVYAQARVFDVAKSATEGSVERAQLIFGVFQNGCTIL
jgi:hypothetical protein